PRVADRALEHASPDAVSDARRELLHVGVVALLPPTIDRIDSRPELVDAAGQIHGVVLQVGIYARDDSPPSMGESREQRRRLPLARGLRDHAHSRVMLARLEHPQ